MSSDKKCVKNPFVKILNCIKYSSADICLECDDKFFLNSNKNQCNPHTQTVSGCLTYSKSLNGQCEVCESTHYKNGNTCILRTLTNITSCTTLSLVYDGCSKCADGYRLTADLKKCWADIPNCKVYSEGTDKFICDKC